jgi:hypothetical protein
MNEKMRNKGFVFHHSDWYVKGFLYLRFSFECIEVKTVNENNKSHYFKNDELDLVLSYFKNFT